MRATRHVLGAVPAVLVAAMVSACIGTSGPSTTPGGAGPSESAAPSTDVATQPPSEEPASPAPPESTAPESTEPPPSEPESASAPPSGAPSDEVSIAAACSGSDDNRDFFADAAAALDWSVYCAVLPRGWFVGAGEYRLRGGGSLTITYKGPGGATFQLQEGAVCGDADGCAFHGDGAAAGDAPFGDKTGSLVALSDGTWALVVDAGAPVEWVATGSGIDENQFRGLAADLAVVGD